MSKAEEFIKSKEKELINAIGHDMWLNDKVYFAHEVIEFLKEFENVLSGATVKLREVCPYCHSENINSSEMSHRHCYDCQEIWTRE